jgi:hypothetical protein
VVTAYYIRVSGAAVLTVFVSTETETGSNSITTEVCNLIVDVAQQWISGVTHIIRLLGGTPHYDRLTHWVVIPVNCLGN